MPRINSHCCVRVAFARLSWLIRSSYFVVSESSAIPELKQPFKPSPSIAMHCRQLPSSSKPLIDAFYRSQRSDMRAKGCDQLWVTEDKTIIAALCLHNIAHGYWLTGLLVDATKRRQGLARQLIETALAHCSSTVWLFCDPALSDFYLRLGFSLCRDLPQPLAERLARYQRSKNLCAFSRGPSSSPQAHSLEP